MTPRWMVVCFSAVLITGSLFMSGGSQAAPNDSAKAILRDTGGAQTGTVTFTKGPGNSVTVRVDANGLPPGFHGMHIHDVGLCEAPSFTTAGSHYSPAGGTHAGHAGDLPVLLVAADGTAHSKFVTDRFTMSELIDADVAVIVHANADNYANIPATDVVNPDGSYSTHAYNYDSDAATAGLQPSPGPAPDTTLKTGDAGARHSCGVVVVDPDAVPVADAAQAQATAALKDGTGGVAGTVSFVTIQQTVRIEVEATGLTPGFHGFHVHDVGTCEAPAFTSAGGHYSSSTASHGSHSGDMNVLLANGDGSASASYTTDRFTTSELISANVAVIIHANPDNYANIPSTDAQNPDGTFSRHAYYYDSDPAMTGIQAVAGPAPDTTLKTGDAGARRVCGVVEAIPQPSPTPSPNPTSTAPPAVTAGTSITIRHAASPHEFSGKVSSSRAECRGNRRVIVKKVRRGADLVVGRVRSDAKGSWNTPHLKGRGGRYYAVARRARIESPTEILTCTRARSSRLRVTS